MEPRRESERGAILIAILALATVGLLFVDAMLTSIRTNTRSQRESTDDVRARYVAHAALHQGFLEVMSQTDPDGDGMGAIGIGAPWSLTDAQGAAIGEYVSYVQQVGTNNVLTGVAALPSFADPQFVSSSRAIVNAEMEFLLKPRAGAMAIAGPLNNPEFKDMSANSFSISGDAEAPAIVLSDADAMDEIADELISEYNAGHWTGYEMTGMSETYTHDTHGDFDWPIAYREDAFLSASDLNDYRNTLRTHFLDMADSADRVITDKVYGDHTWGTSDSPEVTLIDTDVVGSSRPFRTRDQTITGAGTLIIKHTIRPRYNLNLDWDGDVVVIGFDGDGGDLLYMYGANATINGNLILLSSDDTEASLEIADSDKDGTYITSNSQRRPTNLIVNGGLLCLAEASSHESEVEVEESSSLTVNGFVGLYGSRIEIEASGSNSSLTINGTLAVGLPPENTRSDDFELEMDGTVTLAYDKELVKAGVEGLTELQTEINLDGSTNQVEYDRFMFTAAISALPGAAQDDLATYHDMWQSGADMGVNMETVGMTEGSN